MTTTRPAEIGSGEAVVVYFYLPAHPTAAPILAVLEQLKKDASAELKKDSDSSGRRPSSPPPPPPPTIVSFAVDKDEVQAVQQVWKDVQLAAFPTVAFYVGGKLVAKVEGANIPAIVHNVKTLSTTAAIPSLMGRVTDAGGNISSCSGGSSSNEPIANAKAAPTDSSAPSFCCSDNAVNKTILEKPVVLIVETDGAGGGALMDEVTKSVVDRLCRLGVGFERAGISSPTVKEELEQRFAQPLPHLFVEQKYVGGHRALLATLDGGAAGASADGGIRESLRPHRLATLEDRLRLLINSHPVMLFMKGTPAAPFCRFSKQLMGLFHSEGIQEFGYFNIFDDNEIREGLKKYSDWPTYPQIYVNGEFIGGIDIAQQILDAGGPGSLKAEITAKLPPS